MRRAVTASVERLSAPAKALVDARVMLRKLVRDEIVTGHDVRDAAQRQRSGAGRRQVQQARPCAARRQTGEEPERIGPAVARSDWTLGEPLNRGFELRA